MLFYVYLPGESHLGVLAMALYNPFFKKLLVSAILQKKNFFKHKAFGDTWVAQWLSVCLWLRA